MSGFLIDTNVISEFVKPSPSIRVRSWFEAADTEALFVSVVTFGEIRLGLEDMPHSKRRSELELWFQKGLPDWFESNLLTVTKPVADRWARLTIAAKRNGISVATADGLIAATALEHDLTLVTRDVKGFSGLGISISNPWE